jgi:hypothetical protein
MLLVDPATVLTSGIRELGLDEIALVGGSASDLELCLATIAIDLIYTLKGYPQALGELIRHVTNHMIGIGHP